jgi:hypothetical protein
MPMSGNAHLNLIHRAKHHSIELLPSQDKNVVANCPKYRLFQIRGQSLQFVEMVLSVKKKNTLPYGRVSLRGYESRKIGP